MSEEGMSDATRCPGCDEWRLRAFSAEGDVKRLRAVLECLTKDPEPTLDEPDDDAEVVIKMRAIARAALDGESVETIDWAQNDQ